MINNQNKEQIDEFVLPILKGIGKLLIKNPGKTGIAAGVGGAAAGAALSGGRGDEEEDKKTDEKEETPSEQTPPKETEPKETPPPMTVPDAGAAGKMGPPAPEPPKPAGVEGGPAGPPTEENSPPPTWQELGKEAFSRGINSIPFEGIYNFSKGGLEGLADRAQQAIDYVKSGKGPFGKGGTVNMLGGSRQNVDIKNLEADARRGLAKVGRTLDARKKRGADQRQDLGEPETVRERDPRFQMRGGGRGFAGRNEQITYDYLSAFFGQELNECIDNISEEQLQEAVDLINLVRVKLADRVS